jgi:hypothetical protein
MLVELQVFYHLDLLKYRRISQLVVVESGSQAGDSQEPNQQNQRSQGWELNSTAV